MAKLLILSFDTFGATQELDRQAYKMGHVVDVEPDNHVWGKLETLPKFWQIDLPGLDPEKVRKFLEPKMDFTDISDPVQVGVRKYKLDPNSMPVNLKNAITTVGAVSIKNLQEAAINTYMKLV